MRKTAQSRTQGVYLAKLWLARWVYSPKAKAFHQHEWFPLGAWLMTIQLFATKNPWRKSCQDLRKITTHDRSCNLLLGSFTDLGSFECNSWTNHHFCCFFLRNFWECAELTQIVQPLQSDSGNVPASKSSSPRIASAKIAISAATVGQSGKDWSAWKQHRLHV